MPHDCVCTMSTKLSKIIYLSQVDITRHYSGSVHIKEVVKALLKQGFEVVLLARSIGNFQKGNPAFMGIEVGVNRW